jgi:hypothetical protein
VASAGTRGVQRRKDQEKNMQKIQDQEKQEEMEEKQ